MFNMVFFANKSNSIHYIGTLVTYQFYINNILDYYVRYPTLINQGVRVLLLECESFVSDMDFSSYVV